MKKIMTKCNKKTGHSWVTLGIVKEVDSCPGFPEASNGEYLVEVLRCKNCRIIKNEKI